MPVNSWIPVARDFTQFLDTQSQRRKKRLQQGIMQSLPGFVASELSTAKTKEDIYRKLPELSAQMFAIDPEIGATATQIANQYGQMKLNQIQEVETEETAKRGLGTLRDTFGNINVMHKGKVTPFANVLDEITPTMRSEDALKFGETILKAGQVKRNAVMDISKGKPLMRVYQMLNGEAVDKPKEYFVNTNRTLDDVSAEESEQLAKYNIAEHERRQSLGNQLYADAVRRKRELETPKVTPYFDTKTGEMGMGMMSIEDGKLKMMDSEGKPLGKDVINKIFKSMVDPQTKWTEYRKVSNDKATSLISLMKEAELLDEDRITKSFDDEMLKVYTQNNRDISKMGYSTNVVKALARSSTNQFGGLVTEIIQKLEKKQGKSLSEDEKNKIWNLWKDYWTSEKLKEEAQSELLDFQKVSDSNRQQTTQKKGAFD